MAEKDINIYLTGVAVQGDAQGDPNSSLGGRRSGTILNALSAVGMQNVTGVTIDEVSPACGTGTASLSFTVSTNTLRFTASGDTAGASVDVSAGGSFEVYSATTTMYLIVTVTAASLPTTDQADTLTLDTAIDNLFASILPDEAQSGSSMYRAVIVRNDSAYTIYSAKVWISANTPFTSDSVKIAVEAPDANGDIQTIAGETFAPTGLTFYTAADETNALLIGDLAAGANYGVWVERVVSATSNRYAENSFTLTFNASTV